MNDVSLMLEEVFADPGVQQEAKTPATLSSPNNAHTVFSWPRVDNSIYKHHFLNYTETIEQLLDVNDVHLGSRSPFCTCQMFVHSINVPHLHSTQQLIELQEPPHSFLYTSYVHSQHGLLVRPSTDPFQGQIVAGPAKPASQSTEKKPRKKRSTAQTLADKPKEPYVEIIAKAILSSKEKKMHILEIYKYMMNKYPCYTDANNSSWKNSVRHNLSLLNCFEKCERSEQGKGYCWSIKDKFMEPFENGNFRVDGAKERKKSTEKKKKNEAKVEKLTQQNSHSNVPVYTKMLAQGMCRPTSAPTSPNDLVYNLIQSSSEFPSASHEGAEARNGTLLRRGVYDKTSGQVVHTYINPVGVRHPSTQGINQLQEPTALCVASDACANNGAATQLYFQQPKEDYTDICPQMSLTSLMYNHRND